MEVHTFIEPCFLRVEQLQLQFIHTLFFWYHLHLQGCSTQAAGTFAAFNFTALDFIFSSRLSMANLSIRICDKLCFCHDDLLMFLQTQPPVYSGYVLVDSFIS